MEFLYFLLTLKFVEFYSSAYLYTVMTELHETVIQLCRISQPQQVFEKADECWNSGTINTCIAHMKQLLCAAKVQ